MLPSIISSDTSDLNHNTMSSPAGAAMDGAPGQAAAAGHLHMPSQLSSSRPTWLALPAGGAAIGAAWGGHCPDVDKRPGTSLCHCVWPHRGVWKCCGMHPSRVVYTLGLGYADCPSPLQQCPCTACMLQMLKQISSTHATRSAPISSNTAAYV